jgi:hypothetical protein
MRRFASWIRQRVRAGERIAVVSTNYDFALEKLLLAGLEPGKLPEKVDFGVSWRGTDGRRVRLHPRPPEADLAIYKLHGSLHWLRCPLCDHVYIDPLRPLFRLGKHAGRQRGQSGACVCGYQPLSQIIVTPSMVRDVRDPNLLAIWQSALEFLRTAERWTIIGYSMPPEDVAIQSLLLRAYHGRAAPPAIHVVGGQRDAETEGRYRVLFRSLTFDAAGVEGFVAGLDAR